MMPSTIAEKCHINITATKRKTKNAKGQSAIADDHWPLAMAQKERVKPHKGHGYRVR
jgi:hypothetical protein